MMKNQLPIYLNLILKKKGFTVFCAYDGDEALEKVEEVKPDLSAS